MSVKHKRHIFYFELKKKIDKNLLSRRKRAIARITYARDKAGFPKSGNIMLSVCRSMSAVVCQINCVGGITCGPRACSKSFFGG